jgi:hypothetical protein
MAGLSVGLVRVVGGGLLGVGCPERGVEDVVSVLKDAFMSPSDLKGAFRTSLVS